MIHKHKGDIIYTCVENLEQKCEEFRTEILLEDCSIGILSLQNALLLCEDSQERAANQRPWESESRGLHLHPTTHGLLTASLRVNRN